MLAPGGQSRATYKIEEIQQAFFSGTAKQGRKWKKWLPAFVALF
jgi:hypothetical protein